MGDKLILTNADIISSAAEAVTNNKIFRTGLGEPTMIRVYPIPRGGIAAAYAMEQFSPREFVYVTNPKDADMFIDDLIDSGATMSKFILLNPKAECVTLFDKRNKDCISHGKWIVFPWEESAEKSIEDHIVRLLEYVGEDATRGGLMETPKRVAKAWTAWTSGYGQKPEDVLKVFEDGAKDYDEMVIVKDIPFYSHCEHHMAPFFGTATIGYIPNGKIVGLSKLSRLLDIFAKRLQVQERLTNQISDAIMEHLEALGCGVIIRAQHLCMESRGVRKQGHITITSSLKGVMKSQPDTRAEFMALAK